MKREDLLDTVRRLLALAGSPNEHEAQLAAAKAAELMRRHNLELGEVQGQDDWLNEQVAEFRDYPDEVAVVMNLLAAHFFVETYTRSLPGVRRYRLYLFGRPDNVRVAQYVYHVLVRIFRQLMRAQLGPGPLQTRRRSYLCGLRDGFSAKMTAERRETTVQGERQEAALIAQQQADREQALAERGIQLRSNEQEFKADEGAYYRGRQDGQAIQLHTPLPAAGAAEPKRLTAPSSAGRGPT